MAYNLQDVIDFLTTSEEATSRKHPQIFDTRNFVGDPMETIYCKDGVTIDTCDYYGYYEIFGLDEDDFETVRKLVEEE